MENGSVRDGQAEGNEWPPRGRPLAASGSRDTMRYLIPRSLVQVFVRGGRKAARENTTIRRKNEPQPTRSRF